MADKIGYRMIYLFPALLVKGLSEIMGTIKSIFMTNAIFIPNTSCNPLGTQYRKVVYNLRILDTGYGDQ